MANRFFQSWANRRRNPFTKQEQPVQRQETGLIIPTSAPYLVQLTEVPLKELPSSVTVYNVTNSQYMTEVYTSPAAGQFRVDYPAPDGEGTGLIEFNSADAGKIINVNYKGTGSPIITEFLDAIVAEYQAYAYAVAGLQASNNVKNTNDTQRTATEEGGYIKQILVNADYEGSVRIFWQAFCQNGIGISTQLFKNGQPIGTQKTTTSKSPVQYYQDITGGLKSGDLIQIYAQASLDDIGYVKNMRIGFDWVLLQLWSWQILSPIALSNTDPLNATNQDPS